MEVAHKTKMLELTDVHPSISQCFVSGLLTGVVFDQFSSNLE